MAIDVRLYDSGEVAVQVAIYKSKNLQNAINYLHTIGKCNESELAKFLGMPRSTLQHWRQGRCPKYVFEILHILEVYEQSKQ